MHGAVRSRGILEAIGGTPLIRLVHTASGSADIWMKIEAANPSGSAKDRIAVNMVEGAERRGELRAGFRVLEVSGGSTGTALAMVCAVKGYPCTIVTSDAFAPEKLQAMRAFGADLVIVPSTHAKPTDPSVLARMHARAERLRHRPRTVFLDQHSNPDNPAAYGAMADEIIEALAGDFAAFVMVCGSGGCFSGNAAAFKEKLGNRIRCVAVEAAGYRHLSGGQPGAHHIDGVSDAPPLPIMRMDLVDDVVAVSDAEAFSQARWLAEREGVLAGTSSGANLAAAKQVAQQIGPRGRVVTVVCDTGLKYLQGALYSRPGKSRRPSRSS